MSDSMSRAVVRAPSTPATKALRRDLVRLSVHADPCPQVTLRVLGLIAQQSIIPATIAQATRPRGIELEIVFERPSERHGDTILAKVEGLVGVRRARLAALRH